jgi:hypothetical protein
VKAVAAAAVVLVVLAEGDSVFDIKSLYAPKKKRKEKIQTRVITSLVMPGTGEI